MAKAVKAEVETEDGTGISYEQMIKVIKSIKGSPAFVGKQEIIKYCSIHKIETGIPTIDFLGGGGITEGRMTILAGAISSGKSTGTLMIIKALQAHWRKQGKMRMVIYCDPEGSFDPVYATKLGVDCDYVIIKRVKVLEDAFREIDNLVSTGFIGGVVVDSVDAMVPGKVENSDYGDTMGSQSGVLAAHLPKLFSLFLDNNVTSIFIKQCRVKFGTMSKGEVLTFNGGKALRHFADSIYMVKRLSNRNLNYTPVQVKAEKTRSSRMGLCLDMPLGELGFDVVRDLVTVAITHGLIKQSGSWMVYGEFKVQGAEKIMEEIKADPALVAKLRADVYSQIVYHDEIIGESTGEIITEDE
jgi:recombination protein RecA